jgi:hypothetical protein
MSEKKHTWITDDFVRGLLTKYPAPWRVAAPGVVVDAGGSVVITTTSPPGGVAERMVEVQSRVAPAPASVTYPDLSTPPDAACRYPSAPSLLDAACGICGQPITDLHPGCIVGPEGRSVRFVGAVDATETITLHHDDSPERLVVKVGAPAATPVGKLLVEHAGWQDLRARAVAKGHLLTTNVDRDDGHWTVGFLLYRGSRGPRSVADASFQHDDRDEAEARAQAMVAALLERVR